MPLLATLFVTFVVIAVFLLEYFRSPQGRGVIGEYIIRLSLGKNIPGEKYVINDLTLEDSNGKTSQIDHILISRNGVFVIETKNYSGMIFGDESKIYWTQVLKYGKVKNQFYNPVKQNATHIYRLKEITGTTLPLISVVVFIQGNTSNVFSPKVFTIAEMNKYIDELRLFDLTTEQMEELYNKLLYIKNNRTVSKQEHISNIYNTMHETNQGICPRCGGKLVRRNGKYGDFWGCSNYPKCRFIKK